ncbi:MAG: hypothetical protein Q9208_005294 [Pyrenodesmia sp. 3 TL-2023]
MRHVNPSTPIRGTERKKVNEPDKGGHKKSKVSIWVDISDVGKHMGGEEQLNRRLEGAHPQEHERIQRSHNFQEHGTSDAPRAVLVLQSSPQLDPTTSSRPTKRKGRNEPEEASSKRIRLSTEQEENLDDARQLEREVEQLNQRVEVARRRQGERVQRSQSHRGVQGSGLQVAVEVPQSRPQVIPSTALDQAQPVVPEESKIRAKKGGKGSTRRGAENRKTVPAADVIRGNRAASAIKRSRARDKKELALPGLSSFLEQPRRTRSKGIQTFYELSEQGRGLTHKLRRSHRTGRSW